MATAAQISANQLNAALSSGPRTEEGKATSCLNRLSHGLSQTRVKFQVEQHECPEAYAALLSSLLLEYEPAKGSEELLVNKLAEHHWLRRRALNLQDTCFDPETGLVADQKSFSLYLRYAAANERAFHKVLNDLLKLRAEKRKVQIGFESQKFKQAEETRRLELHESRIRLINARAQDVESETDVRLNMEAPLPGHMQIPYDTLRETFKDVVGEVSRKLQSKSAA